MSLQQKITTWWKARQRRKKWNSLPPEQQMAIWAQAIDDTPALREMFRKVLRVHGYERAAGERKLPRR